MVRRIRCQPPMLRAHAGTRPHVARIARLWTRAARPSRLRQLHHGKRSCHLCVVKFARFLTHWCWVSCPGCSVANWLATPAGHGRHQVPHHVEVCVRSFRAASCHLCLCFPMVCLEVVSAGPSIRSFTLRSRCQTRARRFDST